MAVFPSQCPSFFERDREYPDLCYRKRAAKRYIRLIYSADYRLKLCLDVDDVDRDVRIECDRKDVILPASLLTEGRRLTPALKIKILGALTLCPLPSTFQLRVYQLFHLVKLFGWRYNYKSNHWEQV